MDPAENTSFWDSINGLFGTAAKVYGGVTNAQTAAANAKAERAKATAAATSQSSMTKWLLIGGGVLVVVVIAIFALKRGK